MINGLERALGAYATPASLPRRAGPERNGGEELTTVTTHCDKDHWHTPACPHSVFTRTVDEARRRGEYIDLYI